MQLQIKMSGSRLRSVTDLLSEHLVLLLQRLQSSLHLFELEVAAGVGAPGAHQLALQGALGGGGFLQRQLQRRTNVDSETLDVICCSLHRRVPAPVTVVRFTFSFYVYISGC